MTLRRAVGFRSSSASWGRRRTVLRRIGGDRAYSARLGGPALVDHRFRGGLTSLSHPTEASCLARRCRLGCNPSADALLCVPLSKVSLHAVTLPAFAPGPL